ncbi:MAG: diguanylate cyclase [Candidatus Omnitrophica bacterium]|nr:diguanylate cyclase [Candidatus Omnitrophota bacterium]
MGSTTQKQLSIIFSFLVAVFLSYQIVSFLSFLRTTVNPEIYLSRIGLSLAAFLLPILGGWYAFRFMGGVLFALYAFVMVFFIVGISSFPVFLWFLLVYFLCCYGLYLLDQSFENRIATIRVDREQYQNEKNDLEVAYRTKGESISILFEKYSTYYNLRKLAEELSTTLSVSELANKIVQHTSDFIFRGDVSIMTLAQAEGHHLPVIAIHEFARKEAKNFKIDIKQLREGDHFDFWVLRNRRRVIVNDTLQDFRFDVKENIRNENLRSMIIAPLLHEGRVMGTLRVNSGLPDAFTNDDLRLLDTIAVLASSAVSNAVLFEQTEELAIRDSLTGLYLRRYFYSRLKEEHRRALLTHRPLSLLMCDIDHFKQCNDQHGHGVGDLMLIQFSKIVEKVCENAIVARYGGEEFGILLPELSKKEAASLAEKVREEVEISSFDIRREKIKMTVSIGVASLPDDTLDLESLVQKSDEALYEAKRKGRNRVCLSKS